MPEGLEGMDGSDMVLPWMRIIQPMSKEAAAGDIKPGVFLDNVTGQHVKTLRVVPLTLAKGRTWFEPDAAKPSCKSNDSWRPSIEEPFSPVCADKGHRGAIVKCVKAVWLRELTELAEQGDSAARAELTQRKPGENRPPCDFGYNLIALDISEHEEGRPFLIGLSGSSVKPCKGLITYYRTRQLPPCSTSCTMALTTMTSHGRTYYVVDFRDIKLVDPADKYYPRMQEFRGYDADAASEAAGQQDDDVPF
jgi:hypothetical protein